jgi:hypothetical protein
MDTKSTVNLRNQDPFFQYPLTAAPTSEGNVDLPILYYDNSNMITMFWVDYDAAQAMVGPHGLTAIRFAGGKALVAFAFYEYRHTAIAPYNEVGLAIAALPKGTPAPAMPLLSLFYKLDSNRAGFYVVDLPVTTPAACAAGREIWGYPKFVTPISFSLQGARFNGSVSDPAGSGNLVTLSGKAGISVPGPLLDLVLYSRLDGRVLRTLVNTRGGGKVGLGGSLELNIGDSSHVMSRNLHALGLQRAKPAFVSYTHKLQLRLNAGAALP